jgi:hypothetical protein
MLAWLPRDLGAGSMDLDCEFDGTVLEWDFGNGEWDFISFERICTQALCHTKTPISFIT